MQLLPRPMIAPTNVKPPCMCHGSCLESGMRCIERRLSTCQLLNHQKTPLPIDEAICGVFTMFLLLCDGGLGLERSVTCSALGAEQQANTLHEIICRTSTCVLQIGKTPFGRSRGDARHLHRTGALICLRSRVRDPPEGFKQALTTSYEVVAIDSIVFYTLQAFSDTQLGRKQVAWAGKVCRKCFKLGDSGGGPNKVARALSSFRNGRKMSFPSVLSVAAAVGERCMSNQLV
jgi:hypothetical protein